MGIDIIQLQIDSFNISMTQPFDAIIGNENSKMKHLKVRYNNTLRLTLKYIYKIETLSGGADLQMTIAIPFELTPINLLKTKHLYICFQLLQQNATEIIEAIFKTQTNLPNINIQTFAELEEELNSMLELINALEDSEGLK